MIHWETENSTTVDPDTEETGKPSVVLCTASGVLGEWDPADGIYTHFALPGYSGSLLLRIVNTR